MNTEIASQSFFFSPDGRYSRNLGNTAVSAEFFKHFRHQASVHRVALICSSPHVTNNVLGFSPTKTNMTLKNHLILNRRCIFIHGFHGCFFQPVMSLILPPIGEAFSVLLLRRSLSIPFSSPSSTCSVGEW